MGASLAAQPRLERIPEGIPPPPSSFRFLLFVYAPCIVSFLACVPFHLQGLQAAVGSAPHIVAVSLWISDNLPQPLLCKMGTVMIPTARGCREDEKESPT